MKVFQTLYTTNYKPVIEQHDGLITIENNLILLSCFNFEFLFVLNHDEETWDCPKGEVKKKKKEFLYK